MDLEIKDAKEQLDENQRSHDSILLAFENSMTGPSQGTVDENMLRDVENKYQDEMRVLREEFSAVK